MSFSFERFVLLLLVAALAGCRERSEGAPTSPTASTTRQAVSWTTQGAMATARTGHTATLLPDGDVLIVGGTNAPSAERFVSTSRRWAPAQAPTLARTHHTATVLADGRMLVAGGASNPGTAEVYEPATNTWAPAGMMRTGRERHTATRLRDGRVLVVGGLAAGRALASAELFDPTTNTWTDAAPLDGPAGPRRSHTATLLADGKVLVAGGRGDPGDRIDVQRYDAANNRWVSTGSLTTARSHHGAVRLSDGSVLVVGGDETTPAGRATTAERYEPASGTWAPAGALAEPKDGLTATLLPGGQVLVAGGENAALLQASAFLFDPVAGTWSAAPDAPVSRARHTATLLPSGAVLLAGGEASVAGAPSATADVFERGVGAWSEASAFPIFPGPGSLTLLGDGSILAVGFPGFGLVGEPLPVRTFRYDLSTQQWRDAAPLPSMRQGYAATLLQNGRVLISGGYGERTASGGPLYGERPAFLYDPTGDFWMPAGTMLVGRTAHTSTLLEDGRVLVTGGIDQDQAPTVLRSTELYDPSTNTWSAGPDMAEPRTAHRALLLGSGKVLVVGGSDYQSPFAPKTAELFDATAGAWSSTGRMAQERWSFPLIPFADGGALAIGGLFKPDPFSGVQFTTSVEIYEPAGGTWTQAAPFPAAPPVAVSRAHVLASGRVLAEGKWNGLSGVQEAAALYDPALDTWTPAPTFSTSDAGWFSGTSVLTADGRVFVAGYRRKAWGRSLSYPGNASASCGLFDEGGARAPRPTLLMPSPVRGGERVELRGTGFASGPEGSSGTTQSSAADFPLLSLRRANDDAWRRVAVRSWTDSTATVDLPTDLQAGVYWASVWVGGAESLAVPVRVIPRAALGATCTSPLACKSGLCADGVCCDSACDGACDVCDAPGSVGRCTPRPAGQTGAPSCGAYLCSGASPSCPTSCFTADAGSACALGNECVEGRCVSATKPQGELCATANECTSAHCVDGVCCDGACDGACDACDAPGSVGRCVIETGREGAPSCAPYVCGAAASCPTSCLTAADCVDGLGCIDGTCITSMPVADPPPAPPTGCGCGADGGPLAAAAVLALALLRRRFRAR